MSGQRLYIIPCCICSLSYMFKQNLNNLDSVPMSLYNKPSWNHWIFMSNYSCLHTWVPYNTAYGWNRPNVNAQCSLFTYTISLNNVVSREHSYYNIGTFQISEQYIWRIVLFINLHYIRITKSNVNVDFCVVKDAKRTRVIGHLSLTVYQGTKRVQKWG